MLFSVFGYRAYTRHCWCFSPTIKMKMLLLLLVKTRSKGRQYSMNKL